MGALCSVPVTVTPVEAEVDRDPVLREDQVSEDGVADVGVLVGLRDQHTRDAARLDQVPFARIHTPDHVAVAGHEDAEGQLAEVVALDPDPGRVHPAPPSELDADRLEVALRVRVEEVAQLRCRSADDVPRAARDQHADGIPGRLGRLAAAEDVPRHVCALATLDPDRRAREVPEGQAADRRTDEVQDHEAICNARQGVELDPRLGLHAPVDQNRLGDGGKRSLQEDPVRWRTGNGERDRVR
jgi:hypothetical protein